MNKILVMLVRVDSSQEESAAEAMKKCVSALNTIGARLMYIEDDSSLLDKTKTLAGGLRSFLAAPTPKGFMDESEGKP